VTKPFTDRELLMIDLFTDDELVEALEDIRSILRIRGLDAQGNPLGNKTLKETQ
jgi:hypothetical protein